MTADVPDELPGASVPAAQPADANEAPQTGRWVDTLGGDEQRAYWAYVPGEYNTAYAYGLVVWLHPAGDTKEAEILKAWQASCDRRGIILVGPKTADPGGWSPADVDFITDLTEHIREQYVIDPLRIAVHGFGGAARMAAVVAFRNRETFRGLSLAGAPLRTAPPEVDPVHPLQFHFTCGTDDPALENVEEVVEALREMRFPVSLRSVSDLAHEYPSADEVDAIASWVDALDRI